MSKPPTISVLMSAYNNARTLDETIESILAQSYGDFEFLIANDGSQDATGDMIEDWAARDVRIKTLHHANKGIIPTVNLLRQMARGRLIARTDADDISYPQRFARQVEWLDAHPDYGAVASAYDCVDEAGALLPTRPRVPFGHEAILACFEQGPHIPNNPIFVQSSLMLRASAFEAVGGYHAPFRYCEDYDLWLRLAGITRLANMEERLVAYRCHPSQASRKYASEQMLNALVANVAWRARRAGRPDPLAHAEVMPPIDALDALYGAGTAQEVRAKLVPTILYDAPALAGNGLTTVIAHVREGGRSAGLWRAVARLLRLGKPAKAAHLALALIGSAIPRAIRAIIPQFKG